MRASFVHGLPYMVGRTLNRVIRKAWKREDRKHRNHAIVKYGKPESVK